MKYSNKPKRVGIQEIYVEEIEKHLEGQTLTEIAEILGRPAPAVSRYWNDYCPGGIRKLSDEQEEQLKETIAKQRPDDVGFEAKYSWTLRIILLLTATCSCCASASGSSVPLNIILLDMDERIGEPVHCFAQK